MNQVQTIEKTSKKWKSVQLVGVLLLLLSPVMCVGLVQSHEPPAVGAVMFLAGTTLWLVGRIGAWWNHG